MKKDLMHSAAIVVGYAFMFAAFDRILNTRETIYLFISATILLALKEEI